MGEPQAPKKHMGKFRATVVNNVDPERRARIQVIVPDVSPLPLATWALPCLPAVGIQQGMFTAPMIGSGVWVEFEQGDADYPVWVGGFWGSTAEVPAAALLTVPAVPSVLIQTPMQSLFAVSDTPIPPMLGPGVMLRSGASSITIDPTGVTITGPKIMINGVTIVNNGALTVTL
jgi:hypothetical protein